MKSNITDELTSRIFQAKVLNKYDVSFFQCQKTGFVQSEKPYWLDEAYASAITQLDIGLVKRNLEISEKIARLLAKNFNPHEKFLDYAGGYGLLTRLMRDKGFNFSHTERFCQNIFAEHFEANLDIPTYFEAVTAIETIEHIENQFEFIDHLFQKSDSIIFSTEILPYQKPEQIKAWHYLALETGQHISFHTVASLKFLADQFNCHLYTDGQLLHILTKKELKTDPFQNSQPNWLLRKLERFSKKYANAYYKFPKSLFSSDIDSVKKKLHISQPEKIES